MICAAAFVASPAVAKGKKTPWKAYKGQIVTSKKRFPYRFKNDAHFIKTMKKYDTKKFTSNDKCAWNIEYMVFARKPVGTLQAALTFYDITDGGEKMVNSFTIYPHDKKDKIINGNAELSAENNFESHRKYRVVFSRGYGGEVLAETKLVLHHHESCVTKEGGDVAF